ncbi:hypothetical protein A3C23_04930 [Candidatus Roizmanbacteria bacterium RIFCSPHIGHO2_02_FULL_37_13b]|uniref:Uncharacterized protein n=1 Tax=Candidatus Roizmanbacteria bacterium RIFCSPLOWO2_02_FULL_36_11 TaxID=1802071 RepID=A0A1F7JCU9_9BACT|nr:MAG: hypothetical protein A3C23_04930 [Candidatus Roizmanbacteria bacterium RIFCSPHIGHO2_02_FULL_37_13b]OGK53432.1 MAG: hypothetical protein A3H78_02765 [Candidatus Roizmanbacteria bacterium RIFCSPLOWO2_02_FULL_36_11]
MKRNLIKKPAGVTELEDINFQLVDQPIKELYKITAKNLANDDIEHEHTNHLLKLKLAANFQTYRAICKLVKDEPRFPVQGHILARSILDSLFTIFALIDSPEKNTRWFEIAGYKDTMKFFELEKERYSDDILYKDYLLEKEKYFRHFEGILVIKEYYELRYKKILKP